MTAKKPRTRNEEIDAKLHDRKAGPPKGGKPTRKVPNFKQKDYDTVRSKASVDIVGTVGIPVPPGMTPPGVVNSHGPIEFPVITSMGPDVETVTNEKGASQSALPYRFDLVDGPAMFKMAEVLAVGAEKYGVNNWRGIPVEDHLNHMIAHAYAWLAGDHSDEHLSHVCCRAIFAQAVDITDEKGEGKV